MVSQNKPNNKINSTLKVTEISTVFPEYSAICPLAGVRKNPDDDIPDIKRLSSTIEPDLLIPTNDKINYRLFIHTDRKALSSVSINVAILNMDKQKKKKKVKKIYIIRACPKTTFFRQIINVILFLATFFGCWVIIS